MAVDSEDNVYIADWGSERVQVLGPDGRFRTKFRGQATVSKWAQDYLNANPDELEERNKADMEPELDPLLYGIPQEESANIEKLIWGPTSVKVDAQGRVYIVESCRARIHLDRMRGAR